MGVSPKLLTEAEQALDDARWDDARDLFLTLAADEESPRMLEGLSRAAWWTGRTEEALEARERAYSGFRTAGDTERAVKSALWLSQEYEAIGGSTAVAGGWLDRASSLLDGSEPGVEAGWIALAHARRATDPQRMEEESRTALASGKRTGDLDLEVRAQARLGLAVSAGGRVEEGFRLFDEALVTATTEETLALETIGETFCDAFALMEMVGDSQRLAQWSGVMMRFMRRHDYGPLVAFCGTCCGELFAGSGDLEGAERELTTALAKLEQTASHVRCAHPAAKLAELRLLQGRVEQATGLLDTYRGLPEMARVEARLALMADEPGSAVTALERHLSMIGADGPLSVPYLMLLVEAHLAREHVEEAAETAARVEAVATATGLAKAHAEALLAKGQVAVTVGDPAAVPMLEDALRRFTVLDRPLDAARVRLLIAAAAEETNPELAAAEARAAYAAFERTGARRDADAAAAMLRRLGHGSAPGPRTDGTLTRREREVLALLGDGLTNIEIGERLFISPKTVEHHVSRILSKLGVRNRAEAGAHAARRAQP